jgi:glycosyltransferase involved in cell wall biosynthesis
MKKIMIGTPCYDGRIDVWYTNSLVNTIKMNYGKDIEIIPMWVSFDALVQRARNDTIQLAIELDVDALVFIDSDIEWNPEWFFKLLEYDEDVVGGTYRKKGDKEEYVLRPLTTKTSELENGLIEVSGLGTGFVKLSRDALRYLWDNSEPYYDPKDNKERRMICEVSIINQSLYSEDIMMFNKLSNKFKIYLDTTMTCGHVGPYKFVGDFNKWNDVSKHLTKVPRQL